MANKHSLLAQLYLCQGITLAHNLLGALRRVLELILNDDIVWEMLMPLGLWYVYYTLDNMLGKKTSLLNCKCE